MTETNVSILPHAVIAGKFVYHCHAVDHEDKGMMGVVEVTQRS